MQWNVVEPKLYEGTAQIFLMLYMIIVVQQE